MPSVPDSGDVTDTGSDSLADGAVYALGTGLGGSLMGGIGSAAGGVVAGASIGGTKGETLSTLAVANGINSLLFSGGGGGSQGRSMK